MSTFNGLNLDSDGVKQLAEAMTRALKNPTMVRDVTGNAGVNTALGLTGISLESPAKLLYPVPTPLRNLIPRSVQGGIDYSYRQITDINQAKTWGAVAEGFRNSVQKFNEKNVTVSFQSYGIDNNLTQEALYGAMSSVNPSINFDAQAFSTLANLQAAMRLEELLMLGGTRVAIGKPTNLAATATQLPTGSGALTASTSYKVKVSALTLQGVYAGSTGHPAADAPGETDGTASVTIVTAAGGQPGDTSISVSWTAVKGAVAYNVFADTTAGNAPKYVGTVYTNYADVKTIVGATNVPNTADQTGPQTDGNGNTVTQFDGMINLIAQSSTAYVKSLDNATLTGDSTTGVAELETLMKSLWDNYKVSPDLFVVNSAQKQKIDKIVLGTAAPIMRVDLQAGASKITGGISVGAIKNRFYGDKAVPVMVHPDLPPGTILAPVFQLGEYYPQAGIANNFVQKLAFDYARLEFARTQRRDEFGVYASGALTFYAGFGGGMLTNVA